MRSVVGLSSCQLLSVTQCCMRQRPTHVLMLLKICWNAGKCRQGECEAVEMHGSLVSWCLLLADHQCCLYVADRRRCCHCKTVWTSTTPRTTLNTGNDRLPAGRKDKTIVIGVRERERERERERACVMRILMDVTLLDVAVSGWDVYSVLSYQPQQTPLSHTDCVAVARQRSHYDQCKRACYWLPQQAETDTDIQWVFCVTDIVPPLWRTSVWLTARLRLINIISCHVQCNQLLVSQS